MLGRGERRSLQKVLREGPLRRDTMETKAAKDSRGGVLPTRRVAIPGPRANKDFGTYEEMKQYEGAEEYEGLRQGSGRAAQATEGSYIHSERSGTPLTGFLVAGDVVPFVSVPLLHGEIWKGLGCKHKGQGEAGSDAGSQWWPEPRRSADSERRARPGGMVWSLKQHSF